ncbi:MAG: hypothetical protein Kow00102_07810 [Spirochaetota bacterium]
MCSSFCYHIPNGVYTIGITQNSIETLLPYLPPDIKPEYLYHSFPQQTVALQQFAIAMRYVTVSEFAQFIEETGFITQAQKDG